MCNRLPLRTFTLLVLCENVVKLHSETNSADTSNIAATVCTLTDTCCHTALLPFLRPCSHCMCVQVLFVAPPEHVDLRSEHRIRR
jgi:hypothetical protein